MPTPAPSGGCLAHQAPLQARTTRTRAELRARNGSGNGATIHICRITGRVPVSRVLCLLIISKIKGLLEKNPPVGAIYSLSLEFQRRD